MTTRVVRAATVVAVLVVAPTISAQGKHQNAVIDLWMNGKVAFGVFVPNENARRPAAPGGGGQAARPKPLYTKAGGEALAANPLYDYLFLNLEGGYDSDAVKNIADGLRSTTATSRKTLIVRIPAFHEDPAAGLAHVKEIFAVGGDGVTFPHVESLDEAK